MSAASDSPPDTAVTPVRTIGVVAFDGVEIIDLTGPMEVFALANLGLQRAGITREPAYQIRILARQAGLVTARRSAISGTRSGMRSVTYFFDFTTAPWAPNTASASSRRCGMPGTGQPKSSC